MSVFLSLFEETLIWSMSFLNLFKGYRMCFGDRRLIRQYCQNSSIMSSCLLLCQDDKHYIQDSASSLNNITYHMLWYKCLCDTNDRENCYASVAFWICQEWVDVLLRLYYTYIFQTNIDVVLLTHDTSKLRTVKEPNTIISK